MKKLVLLPLALLTLGGLLAACSSGEDSIAVIDPWSRATAPTQETGAIYAELESPVDDRLLSASVPSEVAATTELHETVESDASMEADMGDGDGMSDGEHGASGDSMDSHGMMMMRAVDGIDIPADQPVALEPGGLHIMLLELAEPIESGATIPVTLEFEQAGTVEVDAVARDN